MHTDDDSGHTRRAVLAGMGAVVAGFIAAQSARSTKGPGSDRAWFGGGGGIQQYTPESGDGGVALLIADDYDAASSAVDFDPTLAWTRKGNWYLFGSNAGVIVVSNITLKTGAADYSEAQSMVDAYPTIVYTTNGNRYLFDE